jgi:EmrB/QacA subfamily drug resistance transporter
VFERFSYKKVVATAFVLALFIDILDLTIVNVSLRAIAVDFSASIGTTTWIVLGYSLSLAVWIPISGWVSDRFGCKNTFVFALSVFIIASLLCSQATDLPQLVAARVLQGVGGGMLTPTGTTLLFRAFPPAERAKASGILAIPTILAPALGPVIGGVITDTAGWRWIFAINLPIGLIALVVAVFGLKHDLPAERRPLDVPGFITAAIGFPAAVYFLERGSEEGWLSARMVIAFLVSVLALTFLVLRSLRVDAPMLDLKLLRDRLFRTTNIVSFVSTMAFLGMTFLLPQFLQRVAGYSASRSGLTTFPQAIGLILMSRVAAKMYPKIGPRKMLFASYLGMGVMMLPFVFMSVDTSPWLIRGFMFARGLFMAFSFIPLQAASYARISPADTGRASAIFSTQRQLGAAVGVAILSSILLSTVPVAFPNGPIPAAQINGFTSAFHWAFFGAVVLVVIAGVLSLNIRDSDAAATMAAPVPK